MNSITAKERTFMRNEVVSVEAYTKWRQAQERVDLDCGPIGRMSCRFVRRMFGLPASGEDLGFEYRVQRRASDLRQRELMFRIDGGIYYALLLRLPILGYAVIDLEQTITVLSTHRRKLAPAFVDAMWLSSVKTSEDICDWLGCEPERPNRKR
ncbi:hypothetical protein [Thioalkalivibrio sp. ALE16]|uniref:hypothetical protein n=1 Tax=Thioalkalivibrio sp. ALE16 TaxID=1158172 RepID=UPI0003674414|nr:hypothetical protein [Thioalkalivibrio sp. ALE16]